MSIYNQGFGGGMNPSITVTTTAGATVTVTLGTKSVTAIATGGTAKISVWDYGSYSIHAVLGDAVGDATVDVIAVQDYSVTVELAEPIPHILNNATWATIKEVAEKSQGSNYWAVGDTKQITINGKLSDGLTFSNYNTWVYIIGFDHNREKEGTGIAFGGFKTAQTNGTDVALCDSGYYTQETSGQWFNMNNSTSNIGGWSGCNMRNNILPAVKAALPAELQAVIKKTILYTDNTGGRGTSASYVTMTKDTLYLLAEFEIFGARTYSNTAEQNYQKQYAYYVAGNSKVKHKHNSTATAANWWERSVCADSENSFSSVNSSGNVSNTLAIYSLGISMAFKVGSAAAEPVKGDIIYMNLGNSEPPAGTNNKYRVLDIDGSVAKVLAMYEVNTNTAYGTSTSWQASYVYDVLRKYYGSLNSSARAAIVKGNVIQFSYNFNPASFNASTHASYADFSTRRFEQSFAANVFALDIYEIERYFGGDSASESGVFSTEDLWEMFYDVRTKPTTNTYPWLRSAVTNSTEAWYVSDSSGYIYKYGVTETGFSARPAFYIDLDKISWSFDPQTIA